MAYCVIEGCGSNKIENKDLGLCATHNKARLKGEKPQAAPKKGAGLRPISAKKSVALAAKKVAYSEVDKRPHICVSCLRPTENLTHSHVLTVKQFPQFEAEPLNILLECQDCHTVWEHDKYTASQTQASWYLKMNIMITLAPDYFRLFQSKYPALFDANSYAEYQAFVKSKQ